MRRVPTGWLFAAALLVACGTGPASSSGPAREQVLVLGTTVDAATRESLAGVELLGPKGHKATSDAQGRFRLEGLVVADAGSLEATASDGRHGSVTLRPLRPGALEVVVHLLPAE